MKNSFHSNMSFYMKTELSSLFKFCCILSVCLLIFSETRTDAVCYVEERTKANGQVTKKPLNFRV